MDKKKVVEKQKANPLPTLEGFKVEQIDIDEVKRLINIFSNQIPRFLFSHFGGGKAICENSFNKFNKLKSGEHIPHLYYKAVDEANNDNIIVFDDKSNISLDFFNEVDEFDSSLNYLENEMMDKDGTNILFCFNSNISLRDFRKFCFIDSVKCDNLSINNSIVTSFGESSNKSFYEMKTKCHTLSIRESILYNSLMRDKGRNSWYQMSDARIYNSTISSGVYKLTTIVDSAISVNEVDFLNTNLANCDLKTDVDITNRFCIKGGIGNKILRLMFVEARINVDAFKTFIATDPGSKNLKEILISHPMDCLTLRNLSPNFKTFTLLSSSTKGIFLTARDYRDQYRSIYISQMDETLDISKKISEFLLIEPKPNDAKFSNRRDVLYEQDVKILSEIVVSRLNVLSLLSALNH